MAKKMSWYIWYEATPQVSQYILNATINYKQFASIQYIYISNTYVFKQI